MKKLLFFLIALLILDSISAGDGWEKAKQVVSKAIEWLKKNGIYDDLVNALKAGAKKLAKSICVKKFSEKVCDDIIEWLINAINKHYI